mgnify:CR=1 FL=1
MSAAIFLGFLIGIAAVTLLLSRLGLLLLRTWDGGALKVRVVHAVSLAICCTVYVFQHPAAWLDCGLYAVFQLVWYFVDSKLGWGLPMPPPEQIDRIFK